MWFRFFSLLFIFVGVQVSSAPVWAQGAANVDFTQNVTLKTVPLGFGGAYRAIADTPAAILLNPAGIAQRAGNISAGADWVHRGGVSSDALSIGIVDFKASDSVAMGFSYDRDEFNATDTISLNQFTLALAAPLGTSIFVGGALKGFISKVDSPFVSGPDGADIDLGLLVKPIPMISLGFTLQNLIQGYSLEEFPFQMGAAVALNLEPHVRFAVDFVRNFQTPAPNKINLYFGAEARATEGFYILGGFGLDKIRDNNFYSVGAAVRGPKIGLNFTFSQHLDPSDETYGANLNIFF